jgi:hypothetical protein
MFTLHVWTTSLALYFVCSIRTTQLFFKSVLLLPPMHTSGNETWVQTSSIPEYTSLSLHWYLSITHLRITNLQHSVKLCFHDLYMVHSLYKVFFTYLRTVWYSCTVHKSPCTTMTHFESPWIAMLYLRKIPWSEDELMVTTTHGTCTTHFFVPINTKGSLLLRYHIFLHHHACYCRYNSFTWYFGTRRNIEQVHPWVFTALVISCPSTLQPSCVVGQTLKCR